MWIIGGIVGDNIANDVWSSDDGKNWNEVKPTNSEGFPVRYRHATVAFGDSMWVTGGFATNSRVNDVWNSTNGKTWTQVKDNNGNGYDKRDSHTSVVFDDGKGEKMWVIGGSNVVGNRLNDVWSSTDGVTWTEVTKDSSKKFPARQVHSSVVFNDGTGEKIYVIGGNINSSAGSVGGVTGSDESNDVWSSTNGKTWTPVKDNNENGFSARNGHTSAVFDDKMWVIGGNDSTQLLNDVWSSTNGKTWIEETDNNPRFSIRFRHTSEVFKKRIWLLAGSPMSDISSKSNDVWSLSKD
jgi:dihydrofolate reductase